MHKLFAYGTLLDPAIQVKLFGKTLPDPESAVLHGWEKYTHETYPFIMPKEGSSVHGKVLILDDAQLRIADQWEEVPREYIRRQVIVNGSTDEPETVWVYVKP